jgi:hypothetical protein
VGYIFPLFICLQFKNFYNQHIFINLYYFHHGRNELYQSYIQVQDDCLLRNVKLIWNMKGNSYYGNEPQNPRKAALDGT